MQTQGDVMRRLTKESLSALDSLKAEHGRRIMGSWDRSRRALGQDIRDAYRWAAPSGRWHLGSLVASGAWRALQARVHYTLQNLEKFTEHQIRNSLSVLKSEASLRSAWALAQVTPDGKRLRLPRRGMHEADRPLASGWDERWREKLGAYRQALLSNLRLNALNEGSIEDAAAEVDATRFDTPQFDMESTLGRLWAYWSDDAIAAGMHQPVEDNGDLAEQEIWRTRGDLRVCDDCDANEGLTAEEADGDIPLHPNCNCFWEVVPASFAALLASGDEADRELARQMDAEGLAPDAMVVRDEAGNILGKTVVDFSEWKDTVIGVQGGVR